jgi:hypothetical protein
MTQGNNTWMRRAPNARTLQNRMGTECRTTSWMERKLTREVSWRLSGTQFTGLMSTVEALSCQWRTIMCKWGMKMWNEDVYNGNECTNSRRMNEKTNKRKGKNMTTGITGITFVTLYHMDGFGPKLTWDTKWDRQRYVLRIHCMNLHKQEARFVSITLQFERLGPCGY